MSDPWGESWSDNPNAPRIPYLLYVDEKSYFAGFLVGAILYGTQTRAPVSHFRFVRSIQHSRGCRCSLLSMYERAAQSRQSHSMGHEVGTSGPHYRHVLVCDDILGNVPRCSIPLIHR